VASKRNLTEQEIRTRYILPALQQALDYSTMLDIPVVFSSKSIHVANTINELIAYKIMKDSSSEKKEQKRV